MLKSRFLLLSLAASLSLVSNSFGDPIKKIPTNPPSTNILDLTTAGASATINGAIFTQVAPQPTGTGVIDPFLRVQSKGTESGFNTDVKNPPLDDKSGIWTHSLKLSDVPIVNINGTNYYEFLLDINESKSANNNYLSLDTLQFYTADNGNLDCNGQCSTLPFTSPAWWSLDSSTLDSYILLNYGLNHGSGSGDMIADIPVSAFAGNTDEYLYLYNVFGINHASSGGTTLQSLTTTSDAGFEEWATVQQSSPVSQVPEPASLALLGSGLSFAAMRLRKRK